MVNPALGRTKRIQS